MRLRKGNYTLGELAATFAACYIDHFETEDIEVCPWRNDSHTITRGSIKHSSLYMLVDYAMERVGASSSFVSSTASLNRTPANPYECLIPVPPNFGDLEPECPMQITEFKASGADIYGTLLHRIWGFLNHV